MGNNLSMLAIMWLFNNFISSCCFVNTWKNKTYYCWYTNTAIMFNLFVYWLSKLSGFTAFDVRAQRRWKKWTNYSALHAARPGLLFSPLLFLCCRKMFVLNAYWFSLTVRFTCGSPLHANRHVLRPGDGTCLEPTGFLKVPLLQNKKPLANPSP